MRKAIFPQRLKINSCLGLIIITRSTLKCLQKFDVSCATRPDELAARILRELAEVIALPLTILSRRILHETCFVFA